MPHAAWRSVRRTPPAVYRAGYGPTTGPPPRRAPRCTAPNEQPTISHGPFGSDFFGRLRYGSRTRPAGTRSVSNRLTPLAASKVTSTTATDPAYQPARSESPRTARTG